MWSTLNKKLSAILHSVVVLRLRRQRPNVKYAILERGVHDKMEAEKGLLWRFDVISP